MDRDRKNWSNGGQAKSFTCSHPKHAVQCVGGDALSSSENRN
jgi:hypothetical protein